MRVNGIDQVLLLKKTKAIKSLATSKSLDVEQPESLLDQKPEPKVHLLVKEMKTKTLISFEIRGPGKCVPIFVAVLRDDC